MSKFIESCACNESWPRFPRQNTALFLINQVLLARPGNRSIFNKARAIVSFSLPIFFSAQFLLDRSDRFCCSEVQFFFSRSASYSGVWLIAFDEPVMQSLFFFHRSPAPEKSFNQLFSGFGRARTRKKLVSAAVKTDAAARKKCTDADLLNLIVRKYIFQAGESKRIS